MVQKPKHSVLSILFASVALAGATQSPGAMAETREVEIITSADDEFVFKDPDIEIQKGDTVRWVVKQGTHRLVAVSPANAFEKTGNINLSTAPPVERTFENAVVVKYECEIHPDTMQGKITVK